MNDSVDQNSLKVSDPYLEELIRIKEHTQKEEEELEISRGVDISLSGRGQSIAN